MYILVAHSPDFFSVLQFFVASHCRLQTRVTCHQTRAKSLLNMALRVISLVQRAYRLHGDPVTSCLSDGRWSKDTNVSCKGQLKFLVAFFKSFREPDFDFKSLSMLIMSHIFRFELWLFGLRLTLFLVSFRLQA